MAEYSIYISSTFTDLKEHRQAVYEAIRRIPDSLEKSGDFTLNIKCMEDYVAKDERPVLRCCKDASNADIYVGIFAARYGYIDLSPTHNPDGLSITELEYRAARSSPKKPKIVTLLSHENCAIPQKYIEQDPASLTKLQTLKRELETVSSVSYYKDISHAAHLAQQAVQRAIMDLQGQAAGAPSPASAPLHRIRVGGIPPFGNFGHRFKNRDRQLEELKEFIKGEESCAIVIRGQGGMGKTALASKLCAQIHGVIQGTEAEPLPWANETPEISAVVYEAFRLRAHDKISGQETFQRLTFTLSSFWDRLKAAMPPEEAKYFDSYLSTIGKTAPVIEQARTALRYLNAKRLVLLLDNFEDVLFANGGIANDDLKEVLAGLLVRNSPVRAVITTRRPIVTDRFTTHEIDNGKLADLELEYCEEILREKDPDNRRRTGLADADQGTLHELARALQQIPRALDLAAAYLERENQRRFRNFQDTLTPQQLCKDVQALGRNVMDFLLQRVWEHATQEELSVAKTLALSPSSVSVSTLAALMEQEEEQATDTAGQLADSHLIERDELRRGYRILDRDRDYILSLIPQQEVQAKRNKLADLAAAQKCQPEELERGEQLFAWEDEFQNRIAAGDPRGAWKAIEPITPDILWEKNLARIAFSWFDALLPMADPELRGDLLPGWCGLLWHFGRYTELLKVSREWRKNAEAAEDDINISKALNLESTAHKQFGEFKKAERILRHAVEISENSYGPDHSHLADCLSNLAEILWATNRLEEAEQLIHRAVTIYENSHPKNHPLLAMGLNNMATLLQTTGRLAEAEPIYRRALAILEVAYGPVHPRTAIILSNLGRLLRGINRPEEAEPLIRRALAISESCYSPKHQIAFFLNNLSDLLKESNRLEEAEPLCRRHLEIFLELSRDTGHHHPRLSDGIKKYLEILKAVGHGEVEVHTVINKLVNEYGLSYEEVVNCLPQNTPEN